MTIRNPILPGFNPDPSISRVGEDYYIATSTFEWFPGVQIYHIRYLKHWLLLTRPLVRKIQLDMRGYPDSCGLWAPCLSHDGERFHLIYTDVKRYGRTTVGGASGASLRDFHNYLVTCETIEGDWSDPVHLNSSGFDPSLFHDEDGDGEPDDEFRHQILDRVQGDAASGVEDVVTSEEEAAESVTLCHVPPGNPDAAHTVTVGAPAVPAHLAHGDVEGAERILREIARMPQEHLDALGRRARDLVARELSKAELCGRFCDVLERGVSGESAPA